MNPAAASPGYRLGRFLAVSPHARTIPPHLQADVDALERYHQAGAFQIRDPEQLAAIDEIRDGLETQCENYSRRRAAERTLADYIEGIEDPLGGFRLPQIVEKLRTCRCRGPIGIKPGGGHVIAWEHKCGLVRLCPDESREETMRLAEKYVPAMGAFLNEHPTHRAFYAVLTDHNFPAGRLAYGKKHFFERFKALRAELPEVRGALVVQEDPLSASGEWNIHLNVILLVRGRFDYEKVRRLWGANVHLQQLKGKDLVRTLLEVVKYSAQIVPTKSDEKAARHATAAPAMTEWPHARWLEWWAAQRRTRRVRSYGALYKVPAPEKKYSDMDGVRWVGAVDFDTATLAYRVDLIPGDNFSAISRQSDNFRPYDQATGPPPPH